MSEYPYYYYETYGSYGFPPSLFPPPFCAWLDNGVAVFCRKEWTQCRKKEKLLFHKQSPHTACIYTNMKSLFIPGILKCIEGCVKRKTQVETMWLLLAIVLV